MWPFKRKQNIILNHSQWADSLTPGYPKVKIAINMGLFNADDRMGYEIDFSVMNKVSHVDSPHKLYVNAYSICSKSGQTDEIGVIKLDFIIDCYNYGIRAIFEATTKVINKNKYKQIIYNTTMAEFKKQFNIK